jgi:polyisoprenoid-binding protein YceI
MLKALSLAVVLGSVVSATFVGASQPKVPPQPPVAMRYVTNGEGNKARYRVRERLVGKDLDNDAVGETPTVRGTIALDQRGRVIAAQSSFTADVSKLKSDQARRDRYVKNRILLLDSFPTTTFRATEVKGLTAPLPKTGEAKFQLVGDLTVKGVTRPSTWTITAMVNGDQLTGQAVTKFTFKEFGILQPKVPVLLSVADTITLEYDFAMLREPVAVAAPVKATKK